MDKNLTSKICTKQHQAKHTFCCYISTTYNKMKYILISYHGITLYIGVSIYWVCFSREYIECFCRHKVSINCHTSRYLMAWYQRNEYMFFGAIRCCIALYIIWIPQYLFFTQFCFHAEWSTINERASHDDVINWNHFRVIGHLCGEFTGHRWIPRTQAVARSFDVFFDLNLNKQLSKQSWGSWFETLSRQLWRHCNECF